MAIPVQSSRPGGKRLNKIPILFAVVIIMLFAVSMSFVASERGKDKSATKEGVPSQDVDVRGFNNDETGLLELVDSIPNSAGIHYSPPPADKAGSSDENNSKKTGRDVRKEVLDAIQDGQLADLKAGQKAKAMEKDVLLKLERDSYAAKIDVEMNYLTSVKDVPEKKGLSNKPPIHPSSEGGRPGEVSSKNSRSEGTVTDDVDRKIEYVENKKTDEFVLRESVRAPISDYEVKTGSVIPGTFISAVNSSLPGDIVAQVTRGVFDSRTGRHLLIPQGSKLYGRYDSATVLGQDRLLIVWDRIVFPDTETLSINSMQGVDGRGLSGSKDKVNTHFVKTLLNAFLLSVVSATADKYDKSDSTGFLDGLRSEYGDTIERVISEYLNKRLNIRPEIEIRAGMRFNILISKDLVFNSPYKYGFTKRIVKNEYN